MTMAIDNKLRGPVYHGARFAGFAPELVIDVEPGGTASDRTRSYLRTATGHTHATIRVYDHELDHLVMSAARAKAEGGDVRGAAEYLQRLALDLMS